MKSSIIYPSTLLTWSDIIKQFVAVFLSFRKKKCTSPGALMSSNLKMPHPFSFKRHYGPSTFLLLLQKVNKINSTILGMRTSPLLTNPSGTTCLTTQFSFLSFLSPRPTPFSHFSTSLLFSVLGSETRAPHMVCKHWATSLTLYLFMKVYPSLHSFQWTPIPTHQ